MSLRLSPAVLSARYDGGVMQYLDNGPEPARLRIYSGERPATLGGLISGTLLHELPFTKPPGTVSNGRLTLQPAAAQPVIQATGIAAWAQIVTGQTAVAMDMDCSLAGGGGEVALSTLTLYLGGTVAVALAELT